MDRLVVCFLVGGRIPVDRFGPEGFANLHEGAGPADHTGAVVGWDTMTEQQVPGNFDII